MWGLKQVRNRRDDALARVRWDRLEVLIADYYGAQGYRVEHVGTGGKRQRFDGGIDLKLRKDDQYILVQCKGWNAYQVPHNEVHQLIGLMVNEAATGAILVTSGEFTRAAIEAATRGGHVQLVDGDDLRRMLGPVVEEAAGSAGMSGSRDNGWYGMSAPATLRIAASVGERLLAATEDRIRYGHGSRKRGGAGAVIAYGLGMKLALAVISSIVLLLVFMFAISLMNSAIVSLQPVSKREVVAPIARPIEPARAAVQPLDSDRHFVPAPRRQPTEAEIRESQRKADEAMRVIEATTPEV